MIFLIINIENNLLYNQITRMMVDTGLVKMLRNISKKISYSMGLMLVAVGLLMPLKAMAQEFTPQQNEQIKKMIQEYLFRNPKDLREAIIALQAYELKQQQKSARMALVAQQKNLYGSSVSFVAGNPNGDVTLIEFFDYNCTYCRRSMKDLMTLIDTDPKLKVIFKEFPILGEGSVYAARAAVASMKQEKYIEFHMALMQVRGSTGKGNVLEIAEEVGLDVEKLEKDMKAPYITKEIDEVLRTASAIGINGTPAYVIGDSVIGGAVGLAELRRQIAEVRKSGS